MGVPEPGLLALTTALNVTPWPYTAGLAEEVTTLVVASALMDSLRTPEVLAAKLIVGVVTEF